MRRNTGGSNPTSGSGLADSEALSADSIFDALAHRRRRCVIYCLREYDTPMTLPDLADEVAVRERGTTIAAIPGEEVKRVYMSLYHSHIPKLANADVVAYDQERDMVALAENAAHLAPHLELLEENDPS
ncbi:hypothetical protein ACFQPA_10145 [Halomarina halobia]|uniref:DUF7344 domain-containing protein n=1 Tax=Halomarina halobia TaxID=3033386 RepID=A0ABD6ABJ2_9EURY|nr:hypothetical protein [Halomarina sp. PSR21]